MPCFISAIFVVASPFYLILNKYFIVNYFHSLIFFFHYLHLLVPGASPSGWLTGSREEVRSEGEGVSQIIAAGKNFAAK